MSSIGLDDMTIFFGRSPSHIAISLKGKTSATHTITTEERGLLRCGVEHLSI
jgi:hypothetical protein